MSYKIYYAGGRTYSGEDGLPVGENSRGIQVIIQDHPRVGLEMVTGGDFYILEDGRWRGTDIFGLFDYLMDTGIVLFGRMISSEEYNTIVSQAMKDKAGWLPFERHVSG
jgi:hypothetical protein